MVHRRHLTRAAAFAWRLVSWHRRVLGTRRFRGFDAHQLRDLGLNSLDQW